MNLNMVRPKNETEDLLLSITKNCETLIQQTHTKPQQTLEFEMTKPKETFHFNPPIEIKENWMIGLTDLEVYNSIFNITKENNKFDLYKFPDDKIGGVSYIKVRDEIEKDLGVEDITATDLQDDIIAPIIIEEHKKQVAERMNDGGYMNISARYTSTVFQVFESFLRTQIDLVESDVKVVLEEYNSNFVTYELEPGIYSYRDIAEAVFYILQSEYPQSNSEILIRRDDITRKTKLVVRSGIIAIRFDEKSFFSTILGFTPGWDYKHYNQYLSQKIVNLSNTNKIHLKCDVINGSVVDGIRQPILYSFVLDKPAGYKVFCEPETIHYKKINKSVLNKITFYLEDDNNEEVNFNGETLTFTLQMIKISEYLYLCKHTFYMSNYIYCVINEFSKI